MVTFWEVFSFLSLVFRHGNVSKILEEDRTQVSDSLLNHNIVSGSVLAKGSVKNVDLSESHHKSII